MNAVINSGGERPAFKIVAALVAPPNLAAMACAWKICPRYGG